MTDSEDASQRQNWDSKVAVVLAKIGRISRIYLVVGLVAYGGGSAFIFWLLRNNPNPGIPTAAVMFYFQILVIIFATMVLYPCIGGAFRVGLLANRESMPAFNEMNGLIKDAKPTLSRVDKVGARVEEAFDEGLVEELRGAIKDVREFSQPKGLPPNAGRALGVLTKAKGNGNGEEKS